MTVFQETPRHVCKISCGGSIAAVEVYETEEAPANTIAESLAAATQCRWDYDAKNKGSCFIHGERVVKNDKM